VTRCIVPRGRKCGGTAGAESRGVSLGDASSWEERGAAKGRGAARRAARFLRRLETICSAKADSWGSW
jgi:hypothetical protein